MTPKSKGGQRVLLLSPFMFPEPISTGRYNTKLAESLRDAGHEVTVVASHPLYPGWEPEQTDSQLPGIRIIRGGGKMRYPSGQVGRRALLEAWFAIFGMVWTRRLLSDTDVVIAHVPPTLVAALVCPLLPEHIKLVTIVADLQVVHAGSKGGPIRAVAKRAAGVIERAAFKRSDRVVFMSRSMLNVARDELGLELPDAAVHYPSVTLVDSGECADPSLERMRFNRFNMVYSGALGEKQIPLVLLRLMENVLRTRMDTDAYIFSSGSQYENLIVEASTDVRARFHFGPLVPEECLLELYRNSNVQIVPQKLGTSKGAMPSKVPNLVATRTPIFAITDAGSELEAILKEYPPSRVENTENIELLTEGLIGFCDSVSPLTPEEDAKVNRLVEEQFSMNGFVKEIIGDDQ